MRVSRTAQITRTKCQNGRTQRTARLETFKQNQTEKVPEHLVDKENTGILSVPV